MSISVDTAQKLLDARMRTFPAIPLWHAAIKSELYRTRRLTSPQGRVAKFYGPVTDEMHRQALSFIPQATVVDTINSAWIGLSAREGYGSTFRVLAQIHDSLVISVERDKLTWMLELLNEVFALQYVTIHGVRHTIPHDFKTGPNLGSMKGITL